MSLGYPWQIAHFAGNSSLAIMNPEVQAVFVDKVGAFSIINNYLRVFCLTDKAVARLNSQSGKI